MKRILAWVWSWVLLHFTVFRPVSTFTIPGPRTRLYMWRSHRKVMPRHFKVREVYDV